MRPMTNREREAGLGRWPAFQPEREVRCPNCDWFMQWGDGEEDRTSYFRQSYYNPDWKYFDSYFEDRDAVKDNCPRCKKARVVYTDIVNQWREERIGQTVEFTSIDGSQCFGKIVGKDVVHGQTYPAYLVTDFRNPILKGLIIDKVCHKEIVIAE